MGKKYKIRKTDPFSKAISRYTESMNNENKNTNIYHLYFDGSLIDGTKTPLQLGLEDDDILDAKEIEMPNTFVVKTQPTTISSFQSNQNTDISTNITLQVRFKNKFKKNFAIKKTDKMHILFQAFKNNLIQEQKNGSKDLPSDVEGIKFKFDGLILNTNTTPMEQDMEDMDIIDAE